VACEKGETYYFVYVFLLMEAGSMPRRMEGRLFTGRKKGRPHLRWTDDVVADLRATRIQQWTEKAEDRQQWRLIGKEAKAHQGL
jgi:hypothetical protein